MNPALQYTASKAFSFAASHQLKGLPKEHKCSRLHGHTYGCTIELSGALDTTGFVIDFGDLSVLNSVIMAQYDHQHLNDVMLTNPTSEHLAAEIFATATAWIRSSKHAPRITSVRVTVSESATSQATCAATFQ